MESNNKDILNWAILCPGPSMANHSEFIHNPGCLIAVNGAILKSEAAWWAMCDEEVFCIACNKIRHKPRLWIPASWILHAHRRLPDNFREFEYESWNNLTLDMPVGRGIPWRNYTLFCAIALAILKGAKIINIYGADMAGQGYFESGLENKRTRHVDKRWEDEKFWFEQIVHVCKKQDIEIVRVEAC